ncbi:MAG TPA: MBL fold metallo-hydrolase [Syntrophomonadaceae bacterium]|mgnify:CR=1 FL=1|jgi:ribonuclease BN (tRNA processing enzyme)|nr:MBL fold metallo-hydrolase [Syntrophomonadaceae bacterium]HOQ09484.1 MBL fold metallo-hydrolase [Syntrophomonadaceae bacterium]HPU48442.1 MBL fold metallo-hydrolase [Syntrophomonadaceae bacterium]
MLLRILGCWTPYPRPLEACSGYLVSTAAANLLLDCGHGISAQLTRWLPAEKLDAVIISHFHPDHYADLYAIRHMIRGAIFLKTRQQPLAVYLPQEPAHLFEEFAAMPELQVNAITAGSSFMVGDVEIRPFAVHHSLPSFGFRVENNNQSIVYTADTSYSKSLLDEVRKGTDLLLCECTLIAAEDELSQQLGHLSTLQVGRIAREGGVGMLLATHFWPGYNVGMLQREIEQEYQGKLIMAANTVVVSI